MRAMIRLPALLIAAAAGLATLMPVTAAAAGCGGGFAAFKQGLVDEAVAKGHDRGTAQTFLSGVRQDPKVLKADRAQGVFQMPFTQFARRLISQNRINSGKAKARQHKATFDRMEREYGVSRGVLLAFWAFETDYGSYQGDFNTLNALVTLAHDCRRPHLFRPQVFAALTLYERGEFSPSGTTGAWAGEIGMVQMLPEDIIHNGVDGDGDGRVRLKTSAPDALLSGAKMLRSLGWRAGEPWLQEVVMPTDFDWGQTGLQTEKTGRQWQAMGVSPRGGWVRSDLPGSILLPQGRGGPAFFAYPNFRVYFEWNQSFVYVLTAAYFANRLEGGPVFDAGNPAAGLEGADMKRLQARLQARGFDVGKVDGILGAKTREAVRAMQARLGMAADGWPTQALLSKL